MKYHFGLPARVGPWFVLACLLALTESAGAQTVTTATDPSAAPSAAAPSSAAASPAQVAAERETIRNAHATKPQHKKFSLITIDAVASQQYPLGSDQRIQPGNNTGSQIFIGGIARLYLAPNVAIFFRRINHADVSGATNGSSYGKFGYDIEGDYGAQYRPLRDLLLEGYWKYRYREFSPNAGDATAFSATSKTPSGPRAERAVVLDVDYRLGPRTRIGRVFRLNAESDLYFHHLDRTIIDNPAYIKAGDTLHGQPNGPDSKVLYTFRAYFYLPIWGQKKFVPYVGYENLSSYFDNDVQPSFINRMRYGVLTHLAPAVSLDLYVKNDHGYPASATVTHKTTLYTDLLVHLAS